MSNNYQNINNLKVSEELLYFVNNELLEGTDISPKKFWLEFDKAVHDLAPKNKELLKIRENLQKKLMTGISIIEEEKSKLKSIRNF